MLDRKAEAPVAPVVALKRRTIDSVLISIGALAAVANYVGVELTSQNITFPSAEALTEEGRTDLVKFADHKLDTGNQAEGYASFINGHLQGIAAGATYADLGAPESAAKADVAAAVEAGKPQATIDELQANAEGITGQRNTLFKGETLPSSQPAWWGSSQGSGFSTTARPQDRLTPPQSGTTVPGRDGRTHSRFRAGVSTQAGGDLYSCRSHGDGGDAKEILMSKYVGSWWIKDGIDGRRLEAEGFASTLGGLAQFDWTQNHGDSGVAKSDFVTTANTTQRTDSVDALQMSSHGNPTSFLVWGGSVTTGDTIDFGKNDLEFFATHACDLLEHTATNSVGRWIPAFERLHYMLGFHTSSFSGGGQSSRGQWFAMYAAWFFYWPLASFFSIDMPIREAWAEANELVEGSSVQWAYLRAEAPGVPTYNERLRESEATDPVTNRSFWTARGTC